MLKVWSLGIHSSSSEELLSMMLSSLLQMCEVFCMGIVRPKFHLRYRVMHLGLEPRLSSRYPQRVLVLDTILGVWIVCLNVA